MKGMDLFCSSSASTAVIPSTHVHRSRVRRTPKSYGLLARAPCSRSSLFPTNPKPSYEKHRKSYAGKQTHDLFTHCSLSSSTTRLLAGSDPSFIHNDHSPALRPSSSPRSRNQVVVLRVSLHCKGCAAKVGKHISRMQGVTSFSIEMEKKKVTIVGDVTPLGALASVSKVKNAQLWPSPTSFSSSSSTPMVGI
ncbi:protein SODIUM POTASSIUM ROOT DEFECTIVE 1-like [Prosopis cineraria]|uniref:protein SODIUM POTASSIUM ROOT DEFECTIVE 1-like n=1 Tax=Prosopis cineraria TaxID=364024 RepID=UPI002410B176|nr:protein SODIUM POTASSIUM ROOT DEFECTIVE 1-like [Prosopis cineraria]XP_054816783.1 protein SODIUM POTASSIUM ROOT DEFECTIVE 1-like [Prosopis cineraria]